MVTGRESRRWRSGARQADGDTARGVAMAKRRETRRWRRGARRGEAMVTQREARR